MTRPEGRLFVQLDVNFFKGRRVSGMSDAAQLLYIRGLTLAKDLISDGEIAISQLRHLCSGSESEWTEAIEELVGAGLWLEGPDGYRIDGWERWNDSHEAVHNHRLRGSQYGNHGRYKHDTVPSKRTSRCIACVDKGYFSVPQETFNTVSDSDPNTSVETETETETETEKKQLPVKQRMRTPDPIEGEFAIIWEQYPRKIGREAALRCYLATRRRGVSTEDLLTATRNYGAKRRDEDQQYTKYGKTFFGPDEPWRDFLEGGSAKAEDSSWHGVESDDRSIWKIPEDDD